MLTRGCGELPEVDLVDGGGVEEDAGSQKQPKSKDTTDDSAEGVSGISAGEWDGELLRVEHNFCTHANKLDIIYR